MRILFFFIAPMFSLWTSSHLTRVLDLSRALTIEKYFSLEDKMDKDLLKLKKEGRVMPPFFADIVRVYYPHLLPDGEIRPPCGMELFQVRLALKARDLKKLRGDLKSYRDCWLYQFREHLPPNIQTLLTHLESIKE